MCDDKGKSAFDPALFKDYIKSAGEKARVCPEEGAKAIVDYVEGFCGHYNRTDTRHAFELAVLNIGHTQLGRVLPMFNRLNEDERRAHPGLCEAISLARESLGIRRIPEPGRF